MYCELGFRRVELEAFKKYSGNAGLEIKKGEACFIMAGGVFPYC